MGYVIQNGRNRLGNIGAGVVSLHSHRVRPGNQVGEDGGPRVGSVANCHRFVPAVLQFVIDRGDATLSLAVPSQGRRVGYVFPVTGDLILPSVAWCLRKLEEENGIPDCPL